MIEHEVDDDAGDGNIQPKRQCPTRDSFMTREISALGTAHSDNYKRHDNDGEKRMRRQDCEINRSRNSLPSEASDAVMLMIDDVREQKNDRGTQRRNLTVTMRPNPLSADEEVAEAKQNKT